MRLLNSTALSIWFWSLFIFLVVNIFLSLWFSQLFSKSFNKINNNYLDEIRELKSKRPNDKVVVVIGSSKVRYGFYCPSYYDALFQDRIHVFKIQENGFKLDHFLDDLDIINNLAQSRPDLVLIESDIMLFQPPLETQQAEYYNKYIKRIKYVKNNLILHKVPKLICKIPYLANGNDSTNIKTYQRKLNHKSIIQSYAEKIAVLQTKGVNVDLIQIPYPWQINQLIDKDIDKGKYREVLEVLKSDYHIDFWQMESNMPWSAYIDNGHLNQIGRERFNKWFIPSLTNKLRD